MNMPQPLPVLKRVILAKGMTTAGKKEGRFVTFCQKRPLNFKLCVGLWHKIQLRIIDPQAIGAYTTFYPTVRKALVS